MINQRNQLGGRASVLLGIIAALKEQVAGPVPAAFIEANYDEVRFQVKSSKGNSRPPASTSA